jgi:hypothetical protein
MRRLAPLLLLAACVTTAPGGALDPVSARLSNEGLAVRMSNGLTCRGGAAPAGTRAWTGTLAGCPEGWRYRVALQDRTNPARFIVEAVLTALTLEDALAPAAEVQVFDPSGLATVFVSPPPPAD